MSTAALLADLQSAGVRISSPGGGCLVVDAPLGVITEEIRHALRQHKTEIITLLQIESKKIEQNEHVELLYVFYERAAIIKVDGGIVPVQAIRLAAREVFDTPEKLHIYAEHHPAIQYLLQHGGEIVDVRFSELKENT